jgi:hypothetical protein
VDLIDGYAGPRGDRDRHLTDPRIHRHVFINQIVVENSALTHHLRLSEEVGSIVIEGREPAHDHGTDRDRQNQDYGDPVNRARELRVVITQCSWL